MHNKQIYYLPPFVNEVSVDLQARKYVFLLHYL